MLATTVRNVSWNMVYWICAAEGDMSMCPDPIHPMYGYAMDSKGRPQYLDVVVAAAAGAGQDPMEEDDDEGGGGGEVRGGNPSKGAKSTTKPAHRKPLSPIQTPSSCP